MESGCVLVVVPVLTADSSTGIELYRYVITLTYTTDPLFAHVKQNISIRCIAELDEKHKLHKEMIRVPTGEGNQ